MNDSSKSELTQPCVRPSVCAPWIVLLLPLLALPAKLHAQFNYTTNNGTITITGYAGPGGAVTIPDRINGLPVTRIDDYAFEYCGTATSVSIPDGVTSIGNKAFWLCTNLASVSIPNSVTSIGRSAFEECYSLASVTIPNRLTLIPSDAFMDCGSLTNVTIPDSVTDIGQGAFWCCISLNSVTIPNSVTIIEDVAFLYCEALTSLTIPSSVTTIKGAAFSGCIGLTNVIIGARVASIWGDAFEACTSVTGFFFLGGPPAFFQGSAFWYDSNATIYYLRGTGWGPSFDGLPTALWNPPTIQTPPQTQTTELGSAVCLRVQASGLLLGFLWYQNGTNLISFGSNSCLTLTNVQFNDAGAYTVVVTNAAGAVTGSPAMLQVIAPVQRRPVPGVLVRGQAGNLLNLDYADSLSPVPTWTTLVSVSLAGSSQYCFDLTLPLPPQRFYRAWQSGLPTVVPSLDLHLVPAITLTGNIGNSVRVDAINQFGPTNAWVTLDTVTLTNLTQLYFDTSA